MNTARIIENSIVISGWGTPPALANFFTIFPKFTLAIVIYPRSSRAGPGPKFINPLLASKAEEGRNHPERHRNLHFGEKSQ